MNTAALLLISALCAGTMGFAIQRGATCMVAALEEVVERRRVNRILAIVEASIIVAGGLAFASVLGLLRAEPSAFPFTAWTIAGGTLLGLGAFVARACVFGAIARLGSGEWAYAAVPPGFLLGCVIGGFVLSSMAPHASPAMSPTIAFASLLLPPLALFALWRLWRVIEAARTHKLLAHVWTPHIATSVIGLAFVVLLLTAGPWSYTEALAEAARGQEMMTGARLLLFACLFGGALLGGWTAGKLALVRPSAASVARCLGGGALMGIGSVLIPGSNDGLILIGLPLLQPHAWVALAGMAATILAALLLNRGRMMMAPKRKTA